MNIQQLYQLGLSQCQIAERLDLDRETFASICTGHRRDIRRVPSDRASWITITTIFASGVHNSHKLFLEIQKRGYPGGYSQVRHFLSSWRVAERERAFVRFETAPGEQSQFDWAHFGNFLGHHLYLFALTLCYSRMRYIEFTQRQDLETLLSSIVPA